MEFRTIVFDDCYVNGPDENKWYHNTFIYKSGKKIYFNLMLEYLYAAEPYTFMSAAFYATATLESYMVHNKKAGIWIIIATVLLLCVSAIYTLANFAFLAYSLTKNGYEQNENKIMCAYIINFISMIVSFRYIRKERTGYAIPLLTAAFSIFVSFCLLLYKTSWLSYVINIT
ncbi:hypothetical protein BDAP_000638 [Binucleata daphniae]